MVRSHGEPELSREFLAELRERKGMVKVGQILQFLGEMKKSDGQSWPDPSVPERDEEKQ